MKTNGNILFCGVGGQGILLASEITAYALLEAGMDVKKSEVHGMAQRGGSVVAHLRYGEKVYSPLIEPGTVDIEVAFESMEAVRYLPFLHSGTQVVANSHKILPPAVATGKMEYPADLLGLLSSKVSVLPVDGFAIAKEIGEIRAANVVLVGAMSAFVPVDAELFIQVMKKRLPAKIVDVNLLAFAKGREAAGKTI
jgi:indolepyruvate ferredoxin oxidoreductase beta subunit